jgi:hypothetical protein
MTRIYRALSASDRAFGADRFYGAERVRQPGLWRGPAERSL